jgi:outer membrane protein assembly factor BamB
VLAALVLAGCSSLPTWWPGWLGGSTAKPLPAAPAVTNSVAARVDWTSALGGRSTEGFSPVAGAGIVLAALPDGTLHALEAQSGARRWSQKAEKRLSAAVGSDGRVAVVGTAKGEVLAFEAGGKIAWQTKVSSEVTAPPLVADGIVAVWTSDGRIHGLSAADGAPRWIYQRTNPPLVIRPLAGGVVSRGTLYTGTPGGRLLAIDLATGVIRWESNVSTPKGATELERISDVTSLPVVDDRQVCAIAYQGRLACFELQRGVLTWSREFSSLGGMVGDARYYYLTDDKGAVHALDKDTGASAWKQDKLAGRRPSGPQFAGGQIGVVDTEGRAYLMNRADGAFTAAFATDGSPATTQPVALGSAMVWTTLAGSVVSLSAP